MREKKPKKLPCGAVGCCHIGAPHHHCENCGQTVYDWTAWGRIAPYQPIAPYWYSNGTNIGTSPNSTQILTNGDTTNLSALSLADCTH